MNKERMLEAIGDIDAEFIREAKPAARGRFLRYAGPIAAAAVLVFGLAFVLPKQIKTAPGSNSDPQVTEKTADINTSTPAPDDPSAALGPDPVGTDANGGPFGGAPNGYYGGVGTAIDSSMRAELKALVDRADIVAVAYCEWTGEESPVYTLEEAIKGEPPESFTVKNGVKAFEKAHYLLFLSGADAAGEYGFIAAMISSNESQSTVNMPESFLEADFFATAALAAELAADE